MGGGNSEQSFPTKEVTSSLGNGGVCSWHVNIDKKRVSYTVIRTVGCVVCDACPHTHILHNHLTWTPHKDPVTLHRRLPRALFPVYNPAA